ncbi:CDF-like metal transporter [Cylindrobasidium torrendii FP15055 ss-10]|uniref:CDF-like metal transporter n=1 Tax=Cylindrobasidium torrendii FP15055 ss-10 TaxID=1314674 RepID=A0A0D7B6L7_9AGAR|nr:CDF-like metal transporter [Cylindrobasidium torrendii FP15055 ss-10]
MSAPMLSPSPSSSRSSTPKPGLSPVPSTATFDLERASASTPATLATHDPYNLRNGVTSEEDLAQMRKRKKGKAVAQYQRKQNDLISYLLKPMEEHTSEARDKEEQARLAVKIAVWASLIANFALCIIQMWAAISSLSLSLLATGIDSVFDLGSNILLFWLHRKSKKMDTNKWPVGGARLECIGNIVYGFLMGTVNLIVIVESVQSIATKEGDGLNEFNLPSIIAVAAALGVKVMLFLGCYPFRNNSSQVNVLWEDHRNDILINGFGIIMATGGSKWKWYLDPLGAILIGLLIVVSWTLTIWGEFELLAGKAAPHEFVQLIIYKAMTYSDDIEKIDTVRAYHSGPDYFVEVDIVMHRDTLLSKAHDISQALQDKLEVLPNVERVFVHVDHETTHVPEHRKTV